VYTNVRCTHECWASLSKGYDVAIRGGAVMGLSLVSMGVLSLWLLIKIFNAGEFGLTFESLSDLYDAIAGFGLGGSSIALFGRVGGGIYTKAADVGADLSGKNDFGLDEDDPRNPACIADNVGDNVGDVAGMGADLFGSFAEATCAALVVAAASASFENGTRDRCVLWLGFLVARISFGCRRRVFACRESDIIGEHRVPAVSNIFSWQTFPQVLVN